MATAILVADANRRQLIATPIGPISQRWDILVGGAKGCQQFSIYVRNTPVNPAKISLSL
jgi:hypothetical protein